MINKESIELIKNLSQANGVSGFEDEVVTVAKEYAADFATIKEDHMRNLYLTTRKEDPAKPTILLDAHMDEVGFIVQAIKPNGTLRFLPLGGWVPNNIPAHRVRVRNSQGHYLSGIIASKPPHFMSEKERNQPLSIEDMVIDLGATSAQEVMEKLKIEIGAPVVPEGQFAYDENLEVLTGKAFDCRIGCACLLETLQESASLASDLNIIATLTSQEEVGERGATVAARNVQPDIAIAFEGCPADDTFEEDYMIQSALKKGPMLRHFDVSMITNPRFQKFALDLAKELGIPVQASVRKGGGTNGAVINLVNRGVPCIVIGIPVRYAHTHYGYSAYEDFVSAKKLALELIKHLNKEIIASF